MKTYVGIDPGVQGAVAVMGWKIWDPSLGRDKLGSEITFYDYPPPDIRTICDTTKEVFVAIERAQAMPGQGTVSMFNYGKGYGIYLGLFIALGIPYAEIQPRQWKKEFSLFKLTKDESLASRKKRSVEMAIRLFPGVANQLKLVKHHGRAEALLIAEYARRRNM